jgi:hypothetical protein
MVRPWTVCALIVAAGGCGTAQGWDAHGHRTVTLLALNGLPADAPTWLADPVVRERIAYQSTEPDHWRGINDPTLGHENGPDHYMDVDKLEYFGLTLESLPRFRYEYLRAMAISKHEHPERVKEKYDAAKDRDHTKEWPGYLPYSIAEHYVKLRSSWNTLRMLERVNDPKLATPGALEQARANVINEMGQLSHFVGDAAQPLHTTRHHHGWEGDNPRRYTTNKGFHSEIDGRVLEMHDLREETLKGAVHCDAKVNAKDPWEESIVFIQRSFEKVEPLYALEKSGELRKEAGKQFVTERLGDAASMLQALYWAAYSSSEPTAQQVENHKRFDRFKSSASPGGP